MGRDLKVSYFLDKETSDLARSTNTFNLVKFDEYDGLTSLRNVELGDFDHFEGSCYDLKEVIKNIIDNHDDYDYSCFVIIGNLSIILGRCPDSYDYIVISND